MASSDEERTLDKGPGEDDGDRVRKGTPLTMIVGEKQFQNKAKPQIIKLSQTTSKHGSQATCPAPLSSQKK